MLHKRTYLSLLFLVLLHLWPPSGSRHPPTSSGVFLPKVYLPPTYLGTLQTDKQTGGRIPHSTAYPQPAYPQPALADQPSVVFAKYPASCSFR
ncbi:hypothetical protein LY76DRAFT_435299 [Colletotrichum caudatum]|nr:hypothetical protein LY76DRAFT_435299 [Colletotrichum caudatum]